MQSKLIIILELKDVKYINFPHNKQWWLASS